MSRKYCPNSGKSCTFHDNPEINNILVFDFASIAPSGLSPLSQDLFYNIAYDIPPSDMEKEIFEKKNKGILTWDERKDFYKRIAGGDTPRETKRYLYRLVDTIPGDSNTEIAFGQLMSETANGTEVMFEGIIFTLPSENSKKKAKISQ